MSSSRLRLQREAPQEPALRQEGHSPNGHAAVLQPARPWGWEPHMARPHQLVHSWPPTNENPPPPHGAGGPAHHPLPGSSCSDRDRQRQRFLWQRNESFQSRPPPWAQAGEQGQALLPAGSKAGARGQPTPRSRPGDALLCVPGSSQHRAPGKAPPALGPLLTTQPRGGGEAGVRQRQGRLRAAAPVCL